MPKKFQGENSKSAAARARKAEAKAAADARRQKELEDAYWKDEDKHVMRKEQRKVRAPPEGRATGGLWGCACPCAPAGVPVCAPRRPWGWGALGGSAHVPVCTCRLGPGSLLAPPEGRAMGGHWGLGARSWPLLSRWRQRPAWRQRAPARVQVRLRAKGPGSLCAARGRPVCAARGPAAA